MATGEDVLRIAAREIGYHEKANKRNKYGEWYGMDCCAWCLIFVQWVYHEAGLDLPYKTASCGDLLSWYRRNQPECVTKTKPVRGCVVIFDFPGTEYVTDHTGLFVSKTELKLTTIDGNTSNGSDGNGGYVQQRTRSLGYANPTYIIPKGLEEDMDINRLIEQMTDEQAYKIYCKAESHMQKLPLPTSWDAASELREAMTLGITDGTRPMVPARRYETAIMCKRAVK